MSPDAPVLPCFFRKSVPPPVMRTCSLSERRNKAACLVPQRFRSTKGRKKAALTGTGPHGYNVIIILYPARSRPFNKRTLAMALHIVDHPLIRHKLGLLRKESTSTSEFRMLAKEVARLLTYEATKTLPTEKKMVKGWAGQVEVDYLAGKMITIVPILRAGLGLMDGVLDMVPGAKISVLGMYRNEETLEPVEYYKKLARRIDQRVAIILDPMLATGGSLIAAIDVLKKEGCRQICSLNLVAAPEGVKAVLDKHPDVEIYAAALDDHLNENGYIIPGLGDAGDRIFGTK